VCFRANFDISSEYDFDVDDDDDDDDDDGVDTEVSIPDLPVRRETVRRETQTVATSPRVHRLTTDIHQQVVIVIWTV